MTFSTESLFRSSVTELVKEIPCLLKNGDFHQYVHNKQPLDSFLSQLNPCAHPHNLFKIQFNIILTFMAQAPSGLHQLHTFRLPLNDLRPHL